jgi:hypothetical protein
VREAPDAASAQDVALAAQVRGDPIERGARRRQRSLRLRPDLLGVAPNRRERKVGLAREVVVDAALPDTGEVSPADKAAGPARPAPGQEVRLTVPLLCG